jgi:hypothetical protein
MLMVNASDLPKNGLSLTSAAGLTNKAGIDTKCLRWRVAGNLPQALQFCCTRPARRKLPRQRAAGQAGNRHLTQLPIVETLGLGAIEGLVSIDALASSAADFKALAALKHAVAR